ncbi:putative tyrosine recombinase xerC-like protein, partial [Trachymyrmex zeteki]
GAAPSVEETYPGGREVIWEAFLTNGIPEEAIRISMASISESSLRQYDCSLKKWWSFCVANKLSVYEAEVPDVIRFLSLEFEKGASYGSLNCIRSAISLILGPKIGKNERVRRFFRGLSRLRPSEPKYDSTWDPKIVLEFFKDLTNEDLSLDKLGKKLVTLLALVSGQRIQTLSLIDIRNIVIKEDLIEIKIPDRIKTSRPGAKQPLLVLPFYKEDPNICPARTLQWYLRRTKDLRGKNKPLFISFKKPFKKVSSQTLSRWLKDMLHKSSINTEIFSAHSTRHASTSAAKKKGVSMDVIRKSAGWTESSTTFARFYDRPIIQDLRLFGQAILED